MSFTKKTFLSLLIPAALGTFAGCQQTTASTPKKTGTYTAARHGSVGSNIPQRESVDATGSTYDPNQFSNFQNQQSNLGSRGFNGGGSR